MARQGVYRNIVDGGAAGLFSGLRYRHLFFNLVASDLRSRYRRSYLGILWAVIWPILFSLIIASVAIHVFRQPIQTYILYIITGFTVWDLMAGSLTGGVASIQSGEGYLRQTRLPYLLFPFRTTTFLFVNTLFASLACALMISIFEPSAISMTWLLWPVVLLAVYQFAVPLCLLSAIANMKFRDYQHIIGLLVFLLWYLSPNMVVREVYENYPLKYWTDVNPFASFLDMFRNITLYKSLPDPRDMAVVGIWSVGLWALSLAWLKIEGRRLIYFM